MALRKAQSRQNIAGKLKKSNKVGDKTKNLSCEFLEIGVITERSHDTKFRFGNLMWTSRDTYLAAKNLIRVFYTFISICVDTVPPHF